MYEPKNYNKNGDHSVFGGIVEFTETADIRGLESHISDASATGKGLVKQSAIVAEAAGDTVTKAEFKALLDALKAAGIMATE